MDLAQVGLGNITHVAAATTTAVVTVGSAKTVYVRALEIAVWMHPTLLMCRSM